MANYKAFDVTLKDILPELVAEILKQTNYKHLEEFNQKNPHFRHQLMIQINEPTKAEKRKSAISKVLQKSAKKPQPILSGFTMI